MKLKIFTIVLSLLCGRKERGGGKNKKQKQREKIKDKNRREVKKERRNEGRTSGTEREKN